MENKVEDEIRKRWEQEAKDKADKEEDIQQRPKKRVRAIEYSVRNSDTFADDDLDAALEAMSRNTRSTGRTRGGGARNPGRAAGTKARNKVAEVVEDDDGFVELD